MRHIKGKDLNLLTVFAALWRERNVTKAAKAIGMTQPALSRALSRLRSDFKDPLFVRVARGVTPTERAAELAPSIVSLVDSLEPIYDGGARFDPSRLERVFNIATNDYFESIAATNLLPSLQQEAPGVSLTFRPGQGAIPKEAMERGEVDLMISSISEVLAEGFYLQKLLTDHYRSAVRAMHPMRNSKMTLDEFCRWPHALVTPRGDLKGIVDDALKKKNAKRHVAIGSPNFLSAGWAVAHTDCIVTAPGLFIDRLMGLLQLRDFETPVNIPSLELFQVWHARTQQDPAQKWFRQKIKEACKT